MINLHDSSVLALGNCLHLFGLVWTLKPLSWSALNCTKALWKHGNGGGQRTLRMQHLKCANMLVLASDQDHVMIRHVYWFHWGLASENQLCRSFRKRQEWPELLESLVKDARKLLKEKKGRRVVNSTRSHQGCTSGSCKKQQEQINDVDRHTNVWMVSHEWWMHNMLGLVFQGRLTRNCWYIYCIYNIIGRNKQRCFNHSFVIFVLDQLIENVI